MITNVCLLLEILSFVFCLHTLYGEKFKLDIITTAFFALYMIIMTVINYYDLQPQYSMIMYFIICLYCGLKFKTDIKFILINVVLSVIIVGSIQMAVMLPFGYILGINWFSKFQLLIVNCLAFFIVILLLPKCKVVRITKYLQSKEKIINIILIVCLTLVSIWLIIYKQYKIYEFYQAIMLFISIACIFILAEQLGKYKIKAKEIETELKMSKLYGDSFQGLIDNIRLRQHEFDNHINTIYSQHFIYNTYDDLVKAQNAYCKVISKENRFSKLLKATDPIIAGFLYGKFIEVDKMGVNIDYSISVKKLEVGIPVYKIVEILGDLINNAVEAIEKTDGANKLYVSLMENDKFVLLVRNESPYINYDEIDKFFTKGFSKKGENRGLGLYNVKKICKDYDLDIYCENIKIDGINWFSFKIIKEKEVLPYN